jgi:hypothetical protein
MCDQLDYQRPLFKEAQNERQHENGSSRYFLPTNIPPGHCCEAAETIKLGHIYQSTKLFAAFGSLLFWL